MVPLLSSVNFTPAASRVEVSLCNVVVLALMIPGIFSIRRIVCIETPELFARSICFQLRKLRAALSCEAVNINSCISLKLVLISKKLEFKSNFWGKTTCFARLI